MFDILVKGFLIGILTSIPVGPIAMLCIQKTLNKGHMHGFFSGLGAATSDTTYAMVALFGLSFVMPFI
ncbi:MAG: LysE family transporter, partial [Paludibacteraceae bacterium]|nr:LysE family transporter [Paludibacteraceae bacterium]